MSEFPPDPAPEAPPPIEHIKTVKYSLPEMLAELKLERASGTMAMEKLQQADIGNLFQSKQKRHRGKPE
jgi:hypothetical protein